VSTRFSTPVLITSDGTRICDSTDIARWASSQAQRGGDDPLFPNAEVADLVQHYGSKYGADTRLVAYWHALGSKSALPKMADANVGRAQALAFRAMAPLGSAMIRNALGVTKERYERSLARVREEVEDAGRRLERTKYLVGDTFTAADLTFAALSAPVLLVTPDEGYGAVLPSLDEVSDDTRALVTEMRGTRAGAFALDVFRRYRHARVTSTSQMLR
jgi:glutathione S-transferase